MKLLVPAVIMLAAWPRLLSSAAEQTQDAATTLLQLENLYDSSVTDEVTRTELRAKFATLRPKVAPNPDPQRAGLWKVKAFAFRELDFTWKDSEGEEHRARFRYREDELERLRRGMAGFADRVWTFTHGSLRIDWDLAVIETPLTQLDGEDSFWPGPDACMPHLPPFKPGEADTVMVFAKVYGDPGRGDPAGEVPQMLLGGAVGALGDLTRHATYIGFNWGSGTADDEPDGEPMLHEWLHSAQWTLEDFQGYPPGLMMTSDGGRMEGEEGGDPCYRRKPGEQSWMRFYEHLMRDHVTRKMWRELSLTRPPDNPWINLYCRRFLVLGPFDAAGQPSLGLDAPFIDESRADPAPGRKAGQFEWRTAASPGRLFDVTQPFGPKTDHVAYLAARARSELDQPAQVRIGSDDGCKLWHNGRLILTARDPRPAAPDQNIVEVNLARGDNLFLLKVSNANGDWAAILRLTDPKGGPLSRVSLFAP